MIKTGFFGGSFNPIHNGHLGLARRILELSDLDEVWFVVSPHNPLKSAGALLSDDVRLEMTRRALSGLTGLRASDCEFRLPRPSYTVDTLRHLAQEHPERSFTLLIGADNWQCFPQWRSHEELLRHHEIAIYPRQGCAVDGNNLPPGVRLLNTGLFNVSSTQVRRLIASSQPFEHLVPPQVALYIKQHNLYGYGNISDNTRI